jgi:putative colanic acid biosynthesis UDP-glucose lipid carrier transferase
MLDSRSAERPSLPDVTEREHFSRKRTATKRSVASGAAKRALDIVIAFSALTALLWAFLAIAVAVATTSPGPIFFRQRRTGPKGRTFTIYKFRTMSAAEDGTVSDHASVNHSRVTPFGAFLRKTSLDEMPQLLNILKGDMSVVGPSVRSRAR